MVRVVLLVDNDRHAVGRVGYLHYGVNDKSVVLFAVTAGDNVKTVADLEQSGEIVFVGLGAVVCDIVAAELVGKSVKLCAALLAECRFDLHRSGGVGDVLAIFEHALHHLGSLRRPASVFDKGNGTILEIALGEVIDKGTHEGENVGVVGGCGKHDSSVAERTRNRLRHIAACEVEDGNVGASAFFQLLGKFFNRRTGMSVNRGIGDHNSLFFDTVRRPGIVKRDIVTEIFCQNGTVQRADHFDIKRCRLFEQRLYLRAVFADDADKIAAGFIVPILVCIVCAELAESVGGEKHLVVAVVRYDNLRPMHHGRADEMEGMTSERELIALGNDDLIFLVILAEKLLHHGKGLCRGNDVGIRINVHKCGDICRMVGLHMLDYKVIGLAIAKLTLNVVQPLVGESGIYGIENGDLVVHYHIRIVAHTVGYAILPLKKIDSTVVNTDISDICRDIHGIYLLVIIYCKSKISRLRLSMPLTWAINVP